MSQERGILAGYMVTVSLNGETLSLLTYIETGHVSAYMTEVVRSQK